MSGPGDRDVETLHSGLALFSSGDYDRAIETIHPEIEWHLTFRMPDIPLDKAVYRGREEVRELWTVFAAGWDELTIGVEEVIATGDGQVVARARFQGRGSASGVEVVRTVFYVFALEDGLLRSIRPFESEAEALLAAGLDGG